jgi:acyl carrier protein
MTEQRIQLLEIIDSIIKNALESTAEDYEKKALQMILSDSTQAANFVAIIEDEFNIEFDDDDINLNFFSNLDQIIELINLRSIT